MRIEDHKALRRMILELLYQAYLDDPLRMVEPDTFFDSPPLTRENIVPNMHYLADRKLVEMMLGYAPPMFAAARITAAGIDLVEHRFQFNLEFPAVAGGPDAEIPALLERLVEEGDFLPIDGIARRQLLGDLQFLREELSRPVERWRPRLVRALLDAVDEHRARSGQRLECLERLRFAVGALIGPTARE
jgi:hypothetical protein